MTSVAKNGFEYEDYDIANYANAKKYKLKCNITNKEYIGVSIKPINNYLSTIKTDYKLYLCNKRKYRNYFDILKNNNYTIELIEQIPSINFTHMMQNKNT